VYPSCGSRGGDAGSDSTSGTGGVAGAGGTGGVGGTAGTGVVVDAASVRGQLRSGGSPLAGVVVVVDGKPTVTDDNGAYGSDDVPATKRG
jgi:hypothetical protein